MSGPQKRNGEFGPRLFAQLEGSVATDGDFISMFFEGDADGWQDVFLTLAQFKQRPNPLFDPRCEDQTFGHPIA